ncbi:TPA: anti-phage BREX system Lon protease BrxL, partial [Klebsiella pneumoniae]
MQTHHDLPVPAVSEGEPVAEGYDLDALLNQHFRGRVVRKDLTKQLKEGANVPVYVLEYLLGMYCASDDDQIVEQGLQNVKRILAD